MASFGPDMISFSFRIERVSSDFVTLGSESEGISKNIRA
jgi:hypothetical protein